MSSSATDMPRDAILYATLTRVWEAYELTGWAPNTSNNRPETLAFYLPEGQEFDCTELEAELSAEVKAIKRYSSKQYDADAKALALPSSDPDALNETERALIQQRFDRYSGRKSYQLKDDLAALVKLREHIQGVKPLIQLRTTDIEGQLVYVMCYMPGEKRYKTQIMRHMQGLHSGGVFESLGIRSTSFTYPRR